MIARERRRRKAAGQAVEPLPKLDRKKHPIVRYLLILSIIIADTILLQAIS